MKLLCSCFDSRKHLLRHVAESSDYRPYFGPPLRGLRFCAGRDRRSATAAESHCEQWQSGNERMVNRAISTPWGGRPSDRTSGRKLLPTEKSNFQNEGNSAMAWKAKRVAGKNAYRRLETEWI